MEFRLKILGGNKAGQEVVVKPGKFFIGRAEDCHLRPHSDLISRHHCVFTHAEDYTSVRDFGSKNGTYVNGERVETDRELRAGDQLKIGPLDFEVVLEARVGGAKQPAVSDVREAVSRFAGRQDSATDDVGDWLSDSGDAPEVDAPEEHETPDETPAADVREASASETMAIANSETVIGGDELRSLLDAASHLHDEQPAEDGGFSEGPKQSPDSTNAGELESQTGGPSPAPAEVGVPAAGPQPAESDPAAPPYPIPGVAPGGDNASPYSGGGYPPGAGGMQGTPGSYPGYPYPPQFAQQGMPYGYWPQPGTPGAGPQQGMPQQGMPQQGMPQQGMPQQGGPQQAGPPQGTGYPPGVTPPYGYPPQFYPGYGFPYGYQPQGGQGEAPPQWPGYPGGPQGYPFGQQAFPGQPGAAGQAGQPTAPMMGHDGPQMGPPAPHFAPAQTPPAQSAPAQTPPAPSSATQPPASEALASPQAKTPPPSSAASATPEPAAAPPPARKPNYFVPEGLSPKEDADEKEAAAKAAHDSKKSIGNSGDAAADTLRKLFSRR